jgi:hypothetical protein
MDKAHLSALLTTAEAVEGKDGFFSIPDGKSITLYVAHDGASMSVSRTTAVKVADGVLYARTAKGETYVLSAADVYGGAIEGGTATTARKAGFI